MDLAYAAADLAMTRAGAITVAELTATGTPAVMVPLPHATADHQAANARAVAAGGGAVVVDDAALDGPAVVAAAAPLLADPERLAGMAAAMRAQAHPAAAEELAALVVEASGRRTREEFLADVAAAATPVDREATGWFESAAAPAGGPSVQRRVDRRTKRMEAYPRSTARPTPPGRTLRPGTPLRTAATPGPPGDLTPPAGHPPTGTRSHERPLPVGGTVHLVGVGGAGMSGLARLLLAAGHRVTGSDRSESATLEALRALGADVWAGHDGARLGRPDLVVASTAIRPTNPELVAARILDIPVLGRAQLLARLMAGKTGIAVAGTHGKTTTTGMVVAILEAAGLDPSFAVGGDFKASGVNAAAGAAPTSWPRPTSPTARSWSCPRPWPWSPTSRPTTSTTGATWTRSGAPSGPSSAGCPPTARPCSAPTTRAPSTWPGPPARWSPTGSPPGPTCGARCWPSTAGRPLRRAAAGEPLGEVALVVPGRHNVANALGAIAAARAAGAPFAAAVAGLAGFTGAARRFHLRAEAGGVTVVDDYAHHPTEVAASLAAARLGGWKRLVAVFQPHLYSRTRLFAAEFGRALAAADLVVVTDVYAAREDPEPGVDGALVAGAARHARPDLDCVYEPDRTALAARVATLVQPGDLVLTLGAGDITTLADELAPPPVAAHEPGLAADAAAGGAGGPRGAGGGGGRAGGALPGAGQPRPVAGPPDHLPAGGPAAVFLRAETLDDLGALAGVLRDGQVPLLVVGRGSNMLVADGGWPGIVLHLGQRFRRVEVEGTELEAGGATPLPSVAARSARASLGGIAFAVAIPGTVGGGVRMNAGAHGSELADRLVWADVFHLTGGGRGGPGAGGADEAGRARLRLPALGPAGRGGGDRGPLRPRPGARGHRPGRDRRGPALAARQPAGEPAQLRQRVRQPARDGRRPRGRAARHEGRGHGGARVSEVHANFIVAADGATAADVLVLIRRAMRRARDELGITLRTEVQLVGDFGLPGGGGPVTQRAGASGRAAGERPPGGAPGRPAHRRAAQGDHRRQGAAPAPHPRLGPGRHRPGRRCRLPDPHAPVRPQRRPGRGRQGRHRGRGRRGQPGPPGRALPGARPGRHPRPGGRPAPGGGRGWPATTPPASASPSASGRRWPASPAAACSGWSPPTAPCSTPPAAGRAAVRGRGPAARRHPPRQPPAPRERAGQRPHRPRRHGPQLKRQVTGVNARSLDSLEFTLKDGSRVLYGLAVDQPAKDAAVLLVRRTLKREGRRRSESTSGIRRHPPSRPRRRITIGEITPG